MRNGFAVTRVLRISSLILLCFFVSCSNPQAKATRFYHQGMKYYQEGKYAEAVLEFKNAVQINPKHAQAQLQLALSYLRLGGGMGNLRLAFDALVRATEADP